MDEGTPFRYGLIDSGFKEGYADNLKMFEGRDDKVIRVNPDITPGRYKEVANELRAAKEHFQELPAKYGIRVVDMDFVIGKNEKDQPVIYTIVDNVKGENLEETEEFAAELKTEMDDFFYRLGIYYADKYHTKTKYLADLGNAQFVYGHKVNENENHIYLVDVDPGFQESFFGEGNEDGVYEMDFEKIIDELYENLLRIEKKFDPPVEFTQAREVFTKLKQRVARERPAHLK